MLLQAIIAYASLLLLLALAAHRGAVVTARVLGVPAFRWFDSQPADAALWRRVLVRAGGALAPLLVCLLLAWCASLVRGEQLATTTVQVEDGAARNAGMVNGDRVVSIDGTRVDGWDALRAAVKGGGAPQRFEVERNGSMHTLLIHPGPSG